MSYLLDEEFQARQALFNEAKKQLGANHILLIKAILEARSPAPLNPDETCTEALIFPSDWLKDRLPLVLWTAVQEYVCTMPDDKTTMFARTIHAITKIDIEALAGGPAENRLTRQEQLEVEALDLKHSFAVHVRPMCNLKADKLLPKLRLVHAVRDALISLNADPALIMKWAAVVTGEQQIFDLRAHRSPRITVSDLSFFVTEQRLVLLPLIRDSESGSLNDDPEKLRLALQIDGFMQAYWATVWFAEARLLRWEYRMLRRYLRGEDFVLDDEEDEDQDVVGGDETGDGHGAAVVSCGDALASSSKMAADQNKNKENENEDDEHKEKEKENRRKSGHAKKDSVAEPKA